MLLSLTIQNWLQDLLRHRISNSISVHLDFRHTCWMLSFPGDSSCLRIAFNPIFYDHNLSHDFPFQTISVLLDTPPFRKELPAPGYSSSNKYATLCLDTNNYFGYDILGLIYWMLCRLEEVKPNPRSLDEHSRFSFFASHAYLHDYITRPIVDEWIIVLDAFLKGLYPRAKFVKPSFEIFLTHDIDCITQYGLGPHWSIFKSFIGRSLRTRSLSLGIDVLKIRYGNLDSLHSLDPYNTFAKLIDLAESFNLLSTFFVKTSHTSDKYDQRYTIDYPPLKKLTSSIVNRGHSLGIHPSYHCFDNETLFTSEVLALRRFAFHDLQLKNFSFGGRMHYLRWSWPTTAHFFSANKITYDSSLYYPDHPGFRCGTCHPFPMFDPIKQVSLDVWQIPLIFMESSVISEFLCLGYTNEAFELAATLKSRCRDVSGIFTILWHNSHLTSDSDIRFLSDLLSY